MTLTASTIWASRENCSHYFTVDQLVRRDSRWLIVDGDHDDGDGDKNDGDGEDDKDGGDDDRSYAEISMMMIS